jgi:hypothetical protein
VSWSAWDLEKAASGRSNGFYRDLKKRGKELPLFSLLHAWHRIIIVMFGERCVVLIFFTFSRLAPLLAFLVITGLARAQESSFTLRLGQGGLREDRAPDGVLGGGGVAVDIKLGKSPWALSFPVEYHTKGPDPSEPYEIANLVAANLLHVHPVAGDRADVYAGGGVGMLVVPRGGEQGSDDMRKGLMFDAVAGINIKNVIWKIGIYAEGKVLYAGKRTDGVKVIDFGNAGFLVGISFRFLIV